MSESLKHLAIRIRNELVEIEYSLQRATEGVKRAKQSGDDYYLDGVALNLHSFYSGKDQHPCHSQNPIIEHQIPFKEKSVGTFDLLIAGLARSRKMTLVTNNTGEFKRVSGLRLENWIK